MFSCVWEPWGEERLANLVKATHLGTSPAESAVLTAVPISLLLRCHENGLTETHLGFHQLAFGKKNLEAFPHIQLSCICVMGTEHFPIYSFLFARSACFYQQKQISFLKMQS